MSAVAEASSDCYSALHESSRNGVRSCTTRTLLSTPSAREAPLPGSPAQKGLPHWAEAPEGKRSRGAAAHPCPSSDRFPPSLSPWVWSPCENKRALSHTGRAGACGGWGRRGPGRAARVRSGKKPVEAYPWGRAPGRIDPRGTERFGAGRGPRALLLQVPPLKTK